MLLKKATDYATWFLKSSIEPIINDYPVSRGRVHGGIAHGQQILEAHLKLHIDTLQARVRELEGATAARDRYI